MTLGLPVYFVASLLEMSEWGGTGAEALKNAIDHIFSEKGRIPLENYREKLISITADGASVNTGARTGLFTRMEIEGDRPCLVKIHCINHRVELAVKAAFEDSSFSAVDKFYTANYALLKNSGAIKSAVKHACTSFDISHYCLTKMSGTRFVSHRRRALKRLLDIWPALISAYETTLLTRSLKPETKGKILGFLKNLRSYEFLCKVCCYLDILDKIAPASLVFEGENVTPGEVKKSIKQTQLELEDISENVCTPDELLDSHLSRFTNIDEENGVLEADFVKAGDMLKKPINRKNVVVNIEGMTCLSNQARFKVSEMKKGLAEKVSELLTERFQSFEEGVFQKLDWFDPRMWEDSRDYGDKEIFEIAEHFEVPLGESGFNQFKLPIEWKKFKIWVKSHFNFANISAERVWKTLLNTKRNDYPNLSLIAELILSIGGSNSSVERAFSLLTSILSNRRLKLRHKTIEDLMIIKLNDKIWSPSERNEILENALKIYLRKRRKRLVDGETSASRTPVFNNDNVIDESESEGYDTEDSDDEENDMEEEQNY